METGPSGAAARWDWRELRVVALREAAQVLTNRHDAEDAAQEAMIRAYRARARCACPDAPHAWIRAIARREAYRRYSRLPLHELSEAPPEGGDDEEIERAHARVAAQDLLDRISPPERALLARRYLLEQSSTEIAAALALPPATVRVRLHRLTKRMREQAGQPA